jgi:hypothetical protein
MMELTGLIGITVAIAGSMLLALFMGEALINLTIRAMHAGVVRADRTAARMARKPQTAARLRVQRV